MAIGEMDLATLGIIITMFITTWAIIFPVLISMRKELSEFTSKYIEMIKNMKNNIEEIRVDIDTTNDRINSCRTCQNEIANRYH